MNAKLNENGKIDLFLSRDMGSNMIKAGEYSSIDELVEKGKELLEQGAKCANGFLAREYAYLSAEKGSTYVFGW